MPEVYLTAEGARDLILKLNATLKQAMAQTDEAIALVKSRTAERDAYRQEADTSHAVAQHNWQVANRLERDLKDWRLRAERAEAKLVALLRRVEWVEGYDAQDFYVQQCPICGADKHDGHKDTCELDAELKGQTDASEASEHPQHLQGRR